MRSLFIGLTLTLSAVPALADEKCTAEVQAAFAKQAQAAKMKTVMTHPGGEGIATRTILLVRPNRMHAITEAPHEEAGRVETISIGQWAWGADSDGAWTEHKPNVAKMIEMDVQKMVSAPAVSANFSCLGSSSFEGKDYAGYRADPGKGDDGVELAATVYVDPVSGLPAYNIVAPTAGGEPRLKVVYSYGDDIVVEPPAGFVEPKPAAASAAPSASDPKPGEAPQKN